MEPEINTLTPENPPKSSNKVLYFVFAFLLLAIVVLIIVIIVVKNTQPITIADDTAAINGTSTDAKALAAAGWSNSEQLANINIKKQELAKINAEAQAMLDENPSNINDVYELYKNYFNEALNTIDNSDDANSEAISYFSELINLLKNNNMEKEALVAYDIFSLDKLSELNQFGLYSNAADLARELNDTEKTNYYQQKADYLYPVWEEQVRKTEEINENFDAYVKKVQEEKQHEE